GAIAGDDEQVPCRRRRIVRQSGLVGRGSFYAVRRGGLVYNRGASKGATMGTLSRRQFLRTSGVVFAATLAPSALSSRPAGADDKTLYFMSRRAGGRGPAGIWVSTKQPDGQWTPAQNLGPNVNSEHVNHCFMPVGLPGEDNTSVFLSLRPRADGTPSTGDIYTTRMDYGAWQPARRHESKLLDSIGFKCRLNAVSRDGLVLGVVSIH